MSQIEYLPLKWTVIVVSPFVLLQCFLAVEELLTVLHGAFEKHGMN
jgi:hypothetical protein